MAQYGWPFLKNNYTALVAPTVNDDVDDDYARGSQWIYGASIYENVNPARGASQWVDLTGTALPAAPCAWSFPTFDGANWINALFTFDIYGDLISDGSGYPVMVECP